MADQHGPCDEVGRSRRSCPQKPCGFAAALGRRYGVAHNSTGPTSVSIDLEIRKGSWGARPEDRLRQRSTLGYATRDVSGTFAGEAIRFSSWLSRSKSPLVGAFGIHP